MTIQSKARQLANKPAEVVSVLSFGAVGDGVTDDAPAINEAIIHANLIAGDNTGIEVLLPQGVYLIRSSIKMLSFVTLNLNNSLINVDFDGAGIVAGQNISGSEGTSIHIKDGYLRGIDPDNRPSQIGLELDQVYVDSSVANIRSIKMGRHGFKLTAVNAVTILNCWANNAGSDVFYMRDCSSVSVIGGAYEGADAANMNTTATWPSLTSKAIHVDNSVYGDYGNTFINVQTERSSYGYYIHNSRGTIIQGHNAHLSGAIAASQIYLSANTDNTVIGGARSLGYTTTVEDVAKGVNVAGSAPVVNYTQGVTHYANSGGGVALQIDAGSIKCAEADAFILVQKWLGASDGGVVKMQTVELADDAVHSFDAVGASSNRSMYFIVNRDRSKGMAGFTANSTDVPTDLFNSGNVSYGNAVLTAGAGDGVDGSLNIYPASSSTMGIKNRLGFTTRFVLLSISTN